MIKLIKLEWKKNQIGKYIRNAVILTALLCLALAPGASAAAAPQAPVPDSEAAFASAPSLLPSS